MKKGYLLIAAVLLACGLLVVPVAADTGQARLSNERIVLRTDHGDIVIALYNDDVPNTAAQMLRLARAGVFTGTDFFRVEPNFVLQLDPNQREPRLTDDLKALLSTQRLETATGVAHKRGVVSLARQDNDPDSGTGSFSIVLRDSPHLDGNYTVFGEVVDGMDVADAIARVPLSGNRPLTRQTIREVVVTDAAGAARLRPVTTSMPGQTQSNGPWVKVQTNYGDLIVEADPNVPNHYAQFIGLARAHAFDGTQFGRVKASTYAQLFGNTSSADLSRLSPELLQPIGYELGASNTRGALAINTQDRTAGIPAITFLLVDSPHLDATHTVIGRVVEGLTVLDAIGAAKVDKDLRPVEAVVIERLSVFASQAELGSSSVRASRVGPAGQANGNVLLALGIAQGALAMAIALLGKWMTRAQIKAFALLSVLGAGVMLWVALVPRGPSSEVLSIGLFLGAVAMFRLMRNFEARADRSGDQSIADRAE